MRLVFLGPPGAGKGTQAQRICSRLGVPQISTGDLFRAAVATGSKLGLEAKAFMDKGALVPDSVVCGLVVERLAAGDCAKGFVLDGFPRTTPQAEFLDSALAERGTAIDKCIEFLVDRDALIARLSHRMACPSCGAVYHLDHAPPAVKGVCDKCGTALAVRADDKPETVRRRLDDYEIKTRPVADYYGQVGKLARIDAGASVGSVESALSAVLTAP